MVMTNRQRGDYFERQTRAALEDRGWVVIRAGGSLGPADLVALRRDKRPLMIACKITPVISPAERVALIEAAEQGGARPILASRPKPGHVDLWTVARTADRLHISQLRGTGRVPRGAGTA